MELGDITSGRIGRVGHSAVPASTELLKSLTSSTISNDMAGFVSYGIKSGAVGRPFNGEAGGVALWRAARATGSVPEDPAGIAARALSDNLDVVA